MEPKHKAYAFLAVIGLAASYFMATFAVNDGGPMAVWYVLMSIGTGIMGSIFAVVLTIVTFGWDD